MTQLPLHPRARRLEVTCRWAGAELIVYDLGRHRAHALDASCATIWQACDGDRDWDALGRELAAQSLPSSPALVELALAELQRAGLLVEPQRSRGISRRQVLQRTGLIGTAAMLLPAVLSLAVPTAAQAQSGCGSGNFPIGMICTRSCQCSSNCCSATTGLCKGAGGGNCRA